ncbi:MAG: hypothetical protein U9P37_08110 [Pseudomonadota bacterium]|nr:hypothetical protein [Pseudomonadota bacterium]
MTRYNNRGASLIAAIFLILVLSFLGWVMLSMSTLASRESVNELYSARAYYDACSAAEVEIVRLDQNLDLNLGTRVNGKKKHVYYKFDYKTAQDKDMAKVTTVNIRDLSSDLNYWQLTTTGIIGKADSSGEISSEHAKRRFIVKFKK